MSQQDLAEHSEALVGGQPPVQKQQVNIYAVMLIIAFLSISLGCLLLYMELTRWGSFPWWNTGGTGAAAGLILPLTGPGRRR